MHNHAYQSGCIIPKLPTAVDITGARALFGPNHWRTCTFHCVATTAAPRTRPQAPRTPSAPRLLGASAADAARGCTATTGVDAQETCSRGCGGCGRVGELTTPVPPTPGADEVAACCTVLPFPIPVPLTRCWACGSSGGNRLALPLPPPGLPLLPMAMELGDDSSCTGRARCGECGACC